VDTGKILQLLHFELRTVVDGTGDGKAFPRLVDAANTLVEDLQRHSLPPHPTASLHFLSILKETRQFDKGKELWLWLVKKGDEHVDAAVYGAAIELLAYGGETLEHLEELYKQAIERFPGNFVQYHLSPEAIVPDRGQSIGLGLLPMTLLQGILTARALRADWRNAYLAFDTALRLLPDITPSRFFDVLIHERPVPEAVRTIHIACRSKVEIPPKTLTKTIARLNEIQGRFGQPAVLENVRIAMTVLDLVRAQVGGGGKVLSHHVSALIKSLQNLVSWCPQNEPECDARQIFNLTISKCARSLLETLVPHVSNPDQAITVYNSLIQLAGHARDTETVIYALHRISELGRVPNEITCRCLLNAAGMCGDPEGIWRYAWKTMVDYTREKGQPLGEREWYTLANSARYVPGDDAIPFVEEQLEALKASVYYGEAARRVYKRGPSRPAPNPKDLDFKTLSSRLEEAVLVTQAQSNIDGFDSQGLLTPLCTSPTLGSFDDLRTVYDELSTDPQQATPKDVEPAIDASGLPYDEHRFQNWIAVNELLAMADRFEKRKDAFVEEALASGSSVEDVDVETRPLQFLEPKGKHLLTLDAMKSIDHPSYDELRDEILRLRGRT